MTISFTVEPSFDDYLAANRLLRWRAWTGPRIIRWAMIMLAIVGGIVFFGASKDGASLTTALSTSLAWGAGATAVWLVVCFGLSGLRLKSVVRKTYDELGTVSLPTAYVFDDHGMSATFADGSSNHDWSRFRDYDADYQVLLLRRTEAMFFLIPLKQLDQGTCEAMFDLLSRAGIKRV